MSSKFYAVNKETGERWNSKRDSSSYCTEAFLIMYDSGCLAVAEYVPYEGFSLKSLDTSKWKPVFKDNLKNLITK